MLVEGLAPERSGMAEASQDFGKVMTEEMSDKTFLRFSTFIQAELGMKMPLTKKPMLQARLWKRLRALGLKTFDEYYDYVFSSHGFQEELPHMIDVVTTNKTDFFREPQHFEFLAGTILPTFLTSDGTADGRLFRAWCAGCSTGEEPYTLAMVLEDFAEQHPGFEYSIIATDISTRVLEHAKQGIYNFEKMKSVPEEFMKKYLLRGKTRSERLVRLVPAVRSKVTFQRLNLNAREYRMRKNLDVIFCRNVIIYFERPTQQTILHRLCQHLKPQGYLFMGHSEALTGMSLPLMSMGNTIYRRTGIGSDKPELPFINLNPGELIFTDKPMIVRTILGSCVAVTMFNSRRGIAAICHALLPHPGNNEAYTANYAENYKYVTYVVPEMARKMRRHGIKNWEIEVKLFGAADMLSEDPEQESDRPVGKLNVEAVMDMLRKEHLHLKTSDVGGMRGRKILFYTHTGEVLLKRLKGSDDEAQEQGYRV